MAETESAAATLDQLCKGAGFGRIVYVDDFFDLSADRIAALIADRSPTELRGISALQLGETGDEFIHDAAKAAAGRIVDRAQVEELFDELVAKVEGTEASNADHVAVKAFKSALGNIAPGSVRQLSMGQWKAQRDTLIQEATDGAVTLFIFDDDFSIEGLGTNAGRDELGWIRTKLAGKRHATVLLTHGAATEDAERDIEAELCNADAATGFRTVVISKEPLQHGTDSLVRRVKYAMLQDQFLELREAVRKAMADAAEDAIDALAKMGVDEFERIIVHSSLTEGAWCPETITRVVWVRQEKAVRKALRTDGRVHDVVAAIEPLALVPAGITGAAILEQACRLQHAEVIDGSDDLEGVFLPLDLGDIFEWNGKRFVLVAQSCELAIRSDGERGRDEDRLVPLVEIQKMTAATTAAPPAPAANYPAAKAVLASLQDCGPSQHAAATAAAPAAAAVQPLSTNRACANECASGDEDGGRTFSIANGQPDGSPLVVLFDRVIYVPTWILDLAVMSPTGDCELASVTAASNLLQKSWRTRLRLLQTRVQREVVSLYRPIIAPAQMGGAGGKGGSPPAGVFLQADQKTRLLRSLLRLPMGCKFQPQLELPSNESWQLKLAGLKRIKRVRDRHATPLLSAFMQYGSRPAYPHALTRIEQR